jgi:hypothetical protein
METLEKTQEDKETTRLRVNVTFDISVLNGTDSGSAAFAKTVQDSLKGNHEQLLTYLQSKNYKVKVQARRNRKPKND